MKETTGQTETSRLEMSGWRPNDTHILWRTSIVPLKDGVIEMLKIAPAARLKPPAKVHLTARAGNYLAKRGNKLFIAFGILMSFALASCVASKTSGQFTLAGRTVSNQRGIFFSGEYSHFEGEGGEVYTLRVTDASDRQRLYDLAPVTGDFQDSCISMRVSGTIKDELDTTGRPVLEVSRVSAAKRVTCPKRR